MLSTQLSIQHQWIIISLSLLVSHLTARDANTKCSRLAKRDTYASDRENLMLDCALMQYLSLHCSALAFPFPDIFSMRPILAQKAHAKCRARLYARRSPRTKIAHLAHIRLGGKSLRRPDGRRRVNDDGPRSGCAAVRYGGAVCAKTQVKSAIARGSIYNVRLIVSGKSTIV